MQFGARASDWQHFAALGLTEDLLPVVSNPKAKISPNSNMKKLGKTPSLYNRDGLVVGIKDWTKRQSTAADIARWSKQSDYGICIQTRNVRAIDIDIADAENADNITGLVFGITGTLPRRWRANSGKCLLPFRLKGQLAKRVIKTEGGAVELLGNGQQFVAAGQHESGERYQWEGVDEIPELSLEQVDELWMAISLMYGTGEIQMRISTSPSAEDIDVEDPVADWLHAHDLVLEEQGRGLVIACPWEGEHSVGEPGDGSTMWLIAGTKGEPYGHFKCLHSHCADMTRQDYLAAVDYQDEDIVEQFENLPALVDEATGVEEKPLPKLERNKSGVIKATIGNVTAVLRHAGMAGWILGFDNFLDQIMMNPKGSTNWLPFTDTHYTQLRIKLEAKGFNPIGREMIRDAVELVARENAFDSAINWLERHVPAWDGVKRVERFLVDNWGAEDSPYMRGVGRYIWTALAGRVLVPGIKADMVPVFVGDQGLLKSTSIRRMSPSKEFFVAVSLHEREDDLSRRLKGKLVVELDELRGLHTRELEAIKAWITREEESWVPKYKEFATTYKRRCIFFGTTNQEQFLADRTGNRRWLPVKVTRPAVDFSEDLLQLWAEGRELFKRHGVHWQVEQLAKQFHEEHMLTDPLEDLVARWLSESDDLDGVAPGERAFITMFEICEGIGIDARKGSAKGDQMRIGEILRARHGYEKVSKRVNGKPTNVYAKKSA